MDKKAIALPALRHDTKLPIILNRHELKELFAAPILQGVPNRMLPFIQSGSILSQRIGINRQHYNIYPLRSGQQYN